MFASALFAAIFKQAASYSKETTLYVSTLQLRTNVRR